MVPFGFLSTLVLEEELWEQVAQVFRARCPSCHPTNSVNVLKENHSTNPNQWPGLILSSSATGLPTEGAFYQCTGSPNQYQKFTPNSVLTNDMQRYLLLCHDLQRRAMMMEWMGQDLTPSWSLSI